MRSLHPPRCYLYRHWYARVANTPYAGAAISDHTAHLTVAKYDGVDQEFVYDAELVARLNRRAPPSVAPTEVDGACEGMAGEAPGGAEGGAAARGERFPWASLARPRLLAALANAFRLLAERADEGSPWGRGQCRTVYGVDVLFAETSSWQEERAAAAVRPAVATPDVQPVLLEVNFSADFGKMIERRPCFFDDVFRRLYLDDKEGPEGAPPTVGGMEPLWEALPI